MLHFLNTLCLFKYIKDKSDIKCTFHVDLYLIYITNHANPVVNVVCSLHIDFFMTNKSL